MRASDADRDKAASIISTAMAEGRLTPEEHSDRLDQIYAARTQADLVPLVRDLPEAAAAHALASSDGAATVAAAGVHRVSRIIAIFGAASRKGGWRVSPQTYVVTTFGAAELDLRDAVVPGREITINTACIFGAVEIIVPPEMHVIDSGIAICGAREGCEDTVESMRPDAPVLHVTGFCFCGAVEIKRKLRKADKGKRKALPQQ